MQSIPGFPLRPISSGFKFMFKLELEARFAYRTNLKAVNLNLKVCLPICCDNSLALALPLEHN